MVRKVGAHAIVRAIGDATVDHSIADGFGEKIRLVWLLNGAMTYEDKEKKVAIDPGECLLTHSSLNYFLNMSDIEIVALSFDAGAHPDWLKRVERSENGLVLKASSAAAASAAGISALMHQSHHDSTSEFVVHSLFELTTGSINHGIVDPPSEQIAPCLFRAHWLVRQNIADHGYTPERLARDLGLSRRSLYNRFAGCGITPAAFIRSVRLKQAKHEIESDPTAIRSLTTVALRNGFSCSSSLSHAIKAGFGVTPGELRNTKTRRNRRYKAD